MSIQTMQRQDIWLWGDEQHRVFQDAETGVPYLEESRWTLGPNDKSIRVWKRRTPASIDQASDELLIKKLLALVSLYLNRIERDRLDYDARGNATAALVGEAS